MLNQLKDKIAQITPDNPCLWGWSSYSQFDEDGIIRECLNRISAVSELSYSFVEIGCGTGQENNTHQLLLDGFLGVWVDGSKANIGKARELLGGLAFPQLLIIEQMVDVNTTKKILNRSRHFLGVESLDFLSVDIDGNDQYVSEALINALKPKLLCVEYNAKFPPPTNLVMRYNPNHVWENDDYFGASLQSWVNFLEAFNYHLVACNLTGANAFFVHHDFLDQFKRYPVADIYQPARYQLINQKSGHPPSMKWLKLVLSNETIHKQNIHVKSRKVQKLELLAKARYGDMVVYAEDAVIGKSLRTSGSFQEGKISEVVYFLKEKFGFQATTFVDIGANIGTHSVFALKSGLFKFVEAFEPDQDNFRLLTKNLSIHDLQDFAKVHLLALSDKKGLLEMEFSRTNFGDHRISPSTQPSVSFGEEIERLKGAVNATTIDALAREEKIDWSHSLVWLDTQGHEGQVFDGASTFLQTQAAPKYIVTEFWPYGLERSAGKASYFKFLQQCEEIYDINQKGSSGFKKTTLEDLIKSYDEMLLATEKEHHPHTDLLLRLKSRAKG